MVSLPFWLSPNPTKRRIYWEIYMVFLFETVISKSLRFVSTHFRLASPRLVLLSKYPASPRRSFASLRALVHLSKSNWRTGTEILFLATNSTIRVERRLASKLHLNQPKNVSFFRLFRLIHPFFSRPLYISLSLIRFNNSSFDLPIHSAHTDRASQSRHRICVEASPWVNPPVTPHHPFSYFFFPLSPYDEWSQTHLSQTFLP